MSACSKIEALTGNIIVDESGEQHFLDNHENFDNRLENYIVGKNPIVLSESTEVEKGREGILEILKTLFNKDGKMPRNIVGRMRHLNEEQVEKLKAWLLSLKVPKVRVTDAIRAEKEARKSVQYRIQPMNY